jgi:hypothetical protein
MALDFAKNIPIDRDKLRRHLRELLNWRLRRNYLQTRFITDFFAISIGFECLASLSLDSARQLSLPD